MRALAASMALIALAACTSSSSATAASPSPSPPAVSTPTAVAWSGPNCRLPVLLWSDAGLESQGGFIDTATGRLTVDPASVMVFPPGGRMRTPVQPFLYGNGTDQPNYTQTSFDVPQQRWLPVPREFVSPDGSAYAYTFIQPGPFQGVHLVDVKTGSDHVIAGTTGDADARGYHYWVVAYQPEGIYVTRVNQLGGGGLLLLDPATGNLKQVSTDATGVYMTVSGRQGWWTLPASSATAASDPYVYHQLLTGVVGQHAETWFERPGFRVFVLGVDGSGRAVVLAQSGESDELWLLSTPDSSYEISSLPASSDLDTMPFKTAVADSGAWWIGSRAGVFYMSGGKLQQVSSTPAVVAGACQAGG